MTKPDVKYQKIVGVIFCLWFGHSMNIYYWYKGLDFFLGGGILILFNLIDFHETVVNKITFNVSKISFMPFNYLN